MLRGLAVLVSGLMFGLAGASAPAGTPPISDFRVSPRSGPAPLEAHFVDQSFSGDTPILRWEWGLGDGGISQESNPTHVYERPGTYDVWLTVTNASGEHAYLKRAAVTATAAGGVETKARPDAASSKRIRLTPVGRGPRIRFARPDNPDVGFLLWAPEGMSFPVLYKGDNELVAGPIDWHADVATGALYYKLDRNDGRFAAHFLPHEDVVECVYTIWPKPGSTPPVETFLNPCQEMVDGVFEGGNADLLKRTWFVSDGAWVSLGSCPEAGLKNVMPLKGTPETKPNWGDPSVQLVLSHRPELPLVACVSRDGQWVSAAAAEHCNGLFNNTLPVFRCIHVHAWETVRPDGPTVLRVNVYLIKGSLDDLKRRYERDVERWKTTPATPQPAEIK